MLFNQENNDNNKQQVILMLFMQIYAALHHQDHAHYGRKSISLMLPLILHGNATMSSKDELFHSLDQPIYGLSDTLRVSSQEAPEVLCHQ